MHGVGIKSMGILMDRIMGNVHPNDENIENHIQKYLKIIKPHCAWTNGNWELLEGIPWNGLENTPGHVKLLSNMLIRLCTGVGKK